MSIPLKGALNDSQANEQTLNLWGLITDQEGVLYGFDVTLDSPLSLNLNIGAGFGFVNGNNSFQRYPIILETSQVLTFGSPPPAGQDRHDLIVVKIEIQTSGITNATIEIVEGTPALSGTQVDPNLVEDANTFYLVLRRVRIIGNSNSIGASQITSTGDSNRPGHNNTFATSSTIFPINPKASIKASYQEAGRFVEKSGDTMTGGLGFSGTSHLGIRLQNLTTAQRNALTASLGHMIYNVDSGGDEIFTSTGWRGGLSQKQINATKLFVEQNFL
jgi:hypothetical protein